MKKFALVAIIALYTGAGINHFWHPAFYIPIIPPYLPKPELLNLLAGMVEIILGLGMAFKRTRYFAAIGIILLLIIFIPVHIYTIQIACPGKNYCFEKWATWGRLFLIHPVLIAWAWRLRYY